MQSANHRPAARIEFNGEDITSRLINEDDPRKACLVSLSVTDEAGFKSDEVEITVDNRDRFLSPAPGDELRIWLGYEPTPGYMGRFRIDTVRKSGPRRLMTITAASAEMTSAIRATRRRSFHEKTLGEIARSIAAEHGLMPAIAAEMDAVAIPHVDQQNESDLAFMQRLATRHGATFKVADGRLLLTPKGSETVPAGASAKIGTLTPNDCSNYEWERGSRGDYSGVVCTYRDGPSGRRRTVTAGNDTGTRHRDRRTYGSRFEAQAAAQAQLRDLRRGLVNMRIDGAGQPAVFAESMLTLDGFDDEIDAEYRVRSVRHTLDSGGFRSSVELEIGGGQAGKPNSG